MDIVARILNFVLMLITPLLLGVFLVRRLHVEWRTFGIGALTFMASQVLHIPFNKWLLIPFLSARGLTNTTDTVSLLVFALFIGLSAGVFEESARYIAYRFWLKEKRSWKNALMFGAGHGGIEAILLGIVAMIAFFQALAYLGIDFSVSTPSDKAELLQSQLANYWSLPWYDAIMGAVERFFSLAFHLSAAVLVLQAFTRRNILWLGAAIIWHTLLDSIAVFCASRLNIHTTEAIIGIFGLASIAIVIAFRNAPPESPGTPHGKGQDAPAPSPLSITKNILPTRETIEDSRYDE